MTTSDMMLAGRFSYEDLSFEVKSIPIPTPDRGEVRIKVRAAGVCLSDVHLIDGTLVSPADNKTEVTLGHEVSGEVDLTGEGVEGFSPGDRVTVWAGMERDGQLLTMGIDYDGGWAEYLVVPADLLVPIPDGLPFHEAAIIPDAVSTPWGAIEWTAKVRSGESVGVWGVGGLGTHALQLLQFSGAVPIVAVDPSPAARDRALDFGADFALDPAEPDFDERLAEITSGKGLDVAFDFAGVGAARKQALDALGFGGRLVLVGISGGPLTIENDLSFQFMRKQVLGHYGSDGVHLQQLVDFTKAGRLSLERSITETIPLSQAAEAVRKLQEKEGDPIRIVLVP